MCLAKVVGWKWTRGGEPTGPHVHTAAPGRSVRIAELFIPLTWILTMPRHDPLHRFRSLSHFLPTEEPLRPRFPRGNVRWWINHTHIKKERGGGWWWWRITLVLIAITGRTSSQQPEERAPRRPGAGASSVMNQVSWNTPAKASSIKGLWYEQRSVVGFSNSPQHVPGCGVFNGRGWLSCRSVGRCSA